MRENKLFVDLLHFNNVSLRFSRDCCCVFEFQFRVAARNQRMICFRIFLGTYRLYHEGSDVTSKKNGVLEYYRILFDTFQNYFIPYRFSSCTERFVCTVMNRNINNSVDLSLLRN